MTDRFGPLAVRLSKWVASMRRACTPLASGLAVSLAILSAAAAWADEAKRFEFAIAERALVSGESTIRVTQGDRVELAWTSDEGVELHLHGYDLLLPVAAGEPAVLAFTAAVAGRFPLTSHGFAGGGDHGHRPLLYIEVYPD